MLYHITLIGDIVSNTTYEDLTKQEFGRLYVSHRDMNFIGKHQGARFVCKCECGNIKTIRASQLKRGKTNSCGCLQKEQQSKKTKKGFQEISGTFWRRLLNNAKKRNLEFSITIEQVWDLF